MENSYTKQLNDKDLLDTWTFTAQEWNVFIKEAKSLKKEDTIYMAIATLIAGIPFLMFIKNISILMASTFVIPLAILIPWIRYKIAIKRLSFVTTNVQVQLYSYYLLINNQKIDLFSKKYWIKNIKIIDGTMGLKMMEFEIAWNTRKGNTFDETRIPIPSNKLEKAEAIIDFYKLYSNTPTN